MVSTLPLDQAYGKNSYSHLANLGSISAALCHNHFLLFFLQLHCGNSAFIKFEEAQLGREFENHMSWGNMLDI